MSSRNSAKSGDAQVFVTLVKWRPAFGSLAQKTLAVPHRLYS